MRLALAPKIAVAEVVSAAEAGAVRAVAEMVKAEAGAVKAAAEADKAVTEVVDQGVTVTSNHRPSTYITGLKKLTAFSGWLSFPFDRLKMIEWKKRYR